MQVMASSRGGQILPLPERPKGGVTCPAVTLPPFYAPGTLHIVYKCKIYNYLKKPNSLHCQIAKYF